MPKFYVSSAKFNKIVESNTHKNAAIKAFKSLQQFPSLAIITTVSEQGFEDNHEEDVYFNTLDILDLTDQIADYKLEDWF